MQQSPHRPKHKVNESHERCCIGTLEAAWIKRWGRAGLMMSPCQHHEIASVTSQGSEGCMSAGVLGQPRGAADGGGGLLGQRAEGPAAVRVRHPPRRHGAHRPCARGGPVCRRARAGAPWHQVVSSCVPVCVRRCQLRMVTSMCVAGRMCMPGALHGSCVEHAMQTRLSCSIAAVTRYVETQVLTLELPRRAAVKALSFAHLGVSWQSSRSKTCGITGARVHGDACLGRQPACAQGHHQGHTGEPPAACLPQCRCC